MEDQSMEEFLDNLSSLNITSIYGSALEAQFLQKIAAGEELLIVHEHQDQTAARNETYDKGQTACGNQAAGNYSGGQSPSKAGPVRKTVRFSALPPYSHGKTSKMEMETCQKEIETEKVTVKEGNIPIETPTLSHLPGGPGCTPKKDDKHDPPPTPGPSSSASFPYY